MRRLALLLEGADVAAGAREQDRARGEDAPAEGDAHEQHDDEDGQPILLAVGPLAEEPAEVAQEAGEQAHGVQRVADLGERVPGGDAARVRRVLLWTKFMISSIIRQLSIPNS